MLKKITAVLAVALVLFSFSGCSFNFEPVESLMHPPHLSNESELEKSITRLIGKDINLSSPQSGDYHSAITLHDIDGDKLSEAIVFYIKNNDSNSVRMSVLKRKNDSWALVSDFAGNGSKVYSIEFYDLNNDGCDDLLVSWMMFGDKINKSLTVYSCSRKGNELQFSACATEPYNLMLIEDCYGNGQRQILLAYTNVAKEAGKSRLRMLTLNEKNRVVLTCETKLDERIISVSSILSDKQSDSQTSRIYIDGEIGDNNMITQVFAWNSKANNFKSIFNAKQDNLPVQTLRSNNLPSRDVDGDGTIEIPLRKAVRESTDADMSASYLLVWSEIDGDSLKPDEYYVVNVGENYMLRFDRSWVNRLFLKSDNSSRVWSFVDSADKEYFRITAFALDDWNENSDKITEMLLVNNDTVYTCTISKRGEKAGIKASDLVKYFSINK